jgi:spore maturation protein SpmB
VRRLVIESSASSRVAVLSKLATGARAGLVTFWDLAKVMVPAYLAALVLQRVGAIGALAHAAAPIMHLLGLPGSAAVPLIVAWVLNLYAAIGAMLPLGLSPPEITVLAVAMLIGHNLIVEGAVTQKAGMNGAVFGVLRALAGLLAAGIANQLMHVR